MKRKPINDNVIMPFCSVDRLCELRSASGWRANLSKPLTELQDRPLVNKEETNTLD